MKKYILSFIAICMAVTVSAQVGIGNATPHAGSILDLSNSSNKALRLPVSSVSPSSIASFDTLGLLFVYKDNMYLKTSTGIKVFTPWKWDGDTTHALSSPIGTAVGIGVQPLVGANVQLTVANAVGEVSLLGTNASIVAGNPTATHLLIDNDEVLVKSNPTTGGTLKLQDEDGVVQIRNASSDAGTGTVVTAYGSMDAKGKMKENGNDLLPVGAIIMWGGGAIPAGWALCDGGTYTTMDGSSLTTPDLRERFIVGAGGDNPGVSGGAYASGTTGGENFHTLSNAEMPIHSHGGATVSAGAHTHDVTDAYDTRDCKDGVFAGQSGCFMTKDYDASTTRTSTSNGAHTHTINNDGGGSAHENRPPFYALAYLMKL